MVIYKVWSITTFTAIYWHLKPGTGLACLPLFLCLFLSVKPLKLVGVHVGKLDPFCQGRVHPLYFTVHLLAGYSVVRMSLRNRAKLYHVARLPQVHFYKIRIAIGKIDDVLR